MTEIPAEGNVLIASGPLTSDALADHIAARFPEQDYLHFFDAVASESRFAWIWTKAWIRQPLVTAPTMEEYDAFWQELCAAKEAQLHGFESQNVFEAVCP